jgi:hypothetical protein
MQYEQLENDIIARIAPGLPPGVDVLALPEKQSDFTKAFKTGRITVAYKGSKFGKPESTNALAQRETLEFELIVQARLLRGSTGVYACLESIKELILGYKLSNTDKVYLTDQALIVTDEKSADTFTFSMSVAAAKLVVEKPAISDYYADTEFPID